MPTFGEHEIERRLFLSGVGGIYRLTRDEKKVVKTLLPLAGVWDERKLREEIDAFLLREKTQKRLAEKCGSWAAVYEVAAIPEEGEEGGYPYRAAGAYAVMDRYERSVHTLIEGRVNVTNDDLRNIFSGVIRGLMDIRAHCGRAHGDLKPTNILLRNTADLAAATVHLTDPAADGALNAEGGAEKKDLTDLAKILYELVNLRPYMGGTIGRTKDWDELGPNGEDWRKLCNGLLGYTESGAEGPGDLEKILASVETWREQPKKSKAPLVAAAVLLVLAAGGVTAFILTRPPKIDFDQPRWEKLCLSYHGWFDGLLENMTEENKKKFSAAPYPTAVIKLLNDAGRDLARYDPKAIAKQRQSATYLAVHPTDDARTGYGPYYTKKGDELVDAVSAAMTPAQWPLLKSLDTTAATYEKRGWLKPAAGIRSLIAGAHPPALPTEPADISERVKRVDPVDILGNIESTITASRTVTDIDARWTRIEGEIKQLPETHVPLLDAFPKFAEELPRSGEPTSQPGQATGTLEDVKSLATAFTGIEAVATELVTDLNRKDREIAFAELAKDPAAQVPANGKITLAMYRHLPEVAQGYFKLTTDPRKGMDWDQKLAAVDGGMIGVIKKANAKDVHLPVLVRDRQAVQRQLAALTPIAAIEKNRAQLETLVARATGDLDKLTREGDEWVSPYIVHPDEYIAQQTVRVNGKPPFATAAVGEQWRKASATFLEKVKAESTGLKVFQYDKYQNYVAKFKALDSIYADFEKRIPAAVAGLSSVGGDDWRHTVAQEVTGKDRETALVELMTTPALHWADDLPQVEEAGYQSFARERVAAYERLRTEAVALIGDYSTIESRLNGLYLRANEPTPGVANWRDLAAKWKGAASPVLADNTIMTALKPLTDRVAELLSVDGIADYTALMGKAGSPAAEVTLAAWRKAGTAAVNESIPALDDEEKVQAHLAEELAAATKAGTLDAKRANEVAAEMKTERPVRWHRWADTLTAAGPIQTALDKRAAFLVTFNPQTDARMIFNDAFYALKKESEKGLKEAALKPAAAAFVKAVQRMPASVSQDKSVVALLALINKPLQQSAEESSSLGAGPKLAGWEQDGNANTTVRRFYYPKKAGAKYTLEFERLAQQVNGKTVYLCNTEMPFGLFADTVDARGRNGAPRFAEITNDGKSSNEAHWFKTVEEPFDGPKIWKVEGGQLVLRTTPIPWLFKGPQDVVFYPSNGTPAAPSAEMPMQQLTPWAAMYVARLLGCRLPTAEEWRAAYEQFEGAGTLPKDGWNLRGAAFAAQVEHAKQVNSSALQYPDQGIFLTPDLMFASITAADAKPWRGDDLAKIAPNRVTMGPGVYAGSTLWFRKVGAEPGQAAPGSGQPGMHDLVGNVAEFVYDGPGANAVLKDANATPAGIDAMVVGAVAESKQTGKANMFVIGGSSLSPPDLGVMEAQALDPEFPATSVGFSDVGFRLAYTAPIDSINDVLAGIFKEPKYLGGR